MGRDKPVSEDNKKISRVLKEAFKGTHKYSRYADEEEKSTIDILSCVDSPWEGVTSYGTIGLSDYSIGKHVDGVPLGVELVGVSQSEFTVFPNIISTCAFNVINSHFRCEPDEIHINVINIYVDSPMKHVLFGNPFLWEEELKTLYFQPRKVVAWLLVVPCLRR